MAIRQPQEVAKIQTHFQEDMTMKNNETVKKAVVCVIFGLLGAVAITCLVLSFVTDKTTPYLPITFGLAAIVNISGLVLRLKKKGNNNGSGENGSIS